MAKAKSPKQLRHKIHSLRKQIARLESQEKRAVKRKAKKPAKRRKK